MIVTNCSHILHTLLENTCHLLHTYLILKLGFPRLYSFYKCCRKVNQKEKREREKIKVRITRTQTPSRVNCGPKAAGLSLSITSIVMLNSST